MMKKERRRFVRGLLLGFCLIFAGFALFTAVQVFNMDAWNGFDPDRILSAGQSLIVYDGDGAEVSLLASGENRIMIDIEDIPPSVVGAFVAIEDARFYEHCGVDVVRIFGAIWADIKAGSYVQGASTISQQLIKLSHLSTEKTLRRKLEEAVLAIRMEQQYSKDEILEMYLNYVYFGGGYYGIEAAARGYFGKSASELTAAEGALLAGVINSPSNYAPHIDFEASVKRRNKVLKEMLECEMLTAEEYGEALAETPVISESASIGRRGYYVDAALSEACGVLGVSMEELLTGGYRIYTAMNAELQTRAEELFADPNMFPAEDMQGALVVIDADTGGVAAMLGGRDQDVALALNRAVDMRRQPGSVIKPIIAYAPALELCGYTTTTMILDEKTTFGDYSPDNMGSRYYGWVTLREAVTKSLNVPAVKALASVTVTVGKQYAEKMGVSFDESDDSLVLALGGFTYGVSPCEIAGAYAVFASGGEYREPYVVCSIRDASGEQLYAADTGSVRVISEETAYILTSMLETAITEGTGRRLSPLNIPIAGKTGTVGAAGGNRDAWMAAYNPEYAAVIWMGCDSAEGGHVLPDDVTGGTYPADMLAAIFSDMYEDGAAPDFPMPENVVEYRLDAHTLEADHVAVLANGLTPADSIVTEVYVKGTEPKVVTDFWSVPLPPDDVAASLGEDGVPVISFTAAEEYILYRLYREDSSGSTHFVGEWAGGGLRVSVPDGSARYGETYSYYVVPAHSLMTLNGVQVTGVASRRAVVSTPDFLSYG